jgi:hypothetical protein
VSLGIWQLRRVEFPDRLCRAKDLGLTPLREQEQLETSVKLSWQAQREWLDRGAEPVVQIN